MRKKIGPLECLCRPGEKERSAVILMHGFGADAANLFPLADQLDPKEQWNFYFPEAPFTVSLGMGVMGRAWFPISLRELESGIDFSRVRPPGLDEAREKVSGLLFELDLESAVLGGFSQGAMVATEVAFYESELLKGLIVYSGALLDEANWKRRAPALAGKPLLQSHGSYDDVIPTSSGEKLFKLLKDAGMKGTFLNFPGAHEIPLGAIRKSAEFLQGLK